MSSSTFDPEADKWVLNRVSHFIHAQIIIVFSLPIIVLDKQISNLALREAARNFERLFEVEDEQAWRQDIFCSRHQSSDVLRCRNFDRTLSCIIFIATSATQSRYGAVQNQTSGCMNECFCLWEHQLQNECLFFGQFTLCAKIVQTCNAFVFYSKVHHICPRCRARRSRCGDSCAIHDCVCARVTNTLYDCTNMFVPNYPSHWLAHTRRFTISFRFSRTPLRNICPFRMIAM